MAQDDWGCDFSIVPRRTPTPATVVAEEANQDVGNERPVKKGAARERFWSRPDKRSSAEHAALTSHMRLNKSLSSVSRKLAVETFKKEHEQRDDPSRWQLDIAFSNAVSVTRLAKEHSVSRTEVRRCVQAAAMVWLRSQEEVLSHAEAMIGNQSLDLFYDKVKWDETQQAIVLDLHLGEALGMVKAKGAWSIMAQRRELGWKLADGTSYVLRLALMPAILVGKITADCFFDALHAQPFSKRLEEFIALARRRSRLALVVREGDADARNVRLTTWERSRLASDRCLYSFFPCVLHQNNILIGGTCAAAGRHIVDGMHAFGKLVRTGNFWVRFVLSVSELVRRDLRVIHSPPPAGARHQRELLLDLFLPPPRTYHGKQPSAATLQKHNDLRSQFLLMVNGTVGGDELVHFCEPHVCACADRAQAVERFGACLQKALFHKRPRVPQVQEWTSVQECMSFLALAVASHSIHRKAFAAAVSMSPASAGHASGVEVLVPAIARQDRPSSQAADVTLSDWHQMYGKRVGYVERNVFVDGESFRIMLLALLVVAEETMTPALLASRRLQRKAVLLDFLRPQTSPASSVAQFVSSLAGDEHPACGVLCRSRGFHSMSSLVEHDMDAAHLARATLAQAAVGVHLRHFHRYAQWPWRLGIIADGRATEAEHRGVADAFMQCGQCCVDDGFGRQLRAQVRSTEDVLSPWIREVLGLWVGLFDADTHDMELRHAFHKHSSTPLSKFEFLAARSVLAEAKFCVAEAGGVPTGGAEASLVEAKVAPGKLHAGPTCELGGGGRVQLRRGLR